MNKLWHHLYSSDNEKIRIEEKLIEIDIYINSKINEVNRIGLFTGISGVCLHKYYMYDYFKDPKYLDDIENIINRIFDILNTSYDVNCSYADGLAGIGILFDFLRRKKIISLNLDDIKSQFGPIIQQEFDKCLKYTNFDFLFGATGLAIYIRNNFSSNKATKELTKLAQALFTASKIDGKGRRIESEQTYFEHDFIGTNLGLAHGLPSIIFLLNKFKPKIASNLNTNKYISEFASFLNNSRNTAPNSFSLFPPYASETLKIENPSTALSWCYGDLGIGITLLQIALANKDSKLEKEATNILLHASKRTPVNYDYVEDPYFCHGSAGIVHIFNKAYYYSCNKHFYKRAQFWLSYLLNQLDAREFIKFEIDENPAIEMLNGITGTSLVLLSTINKKKPDWDSFFLLS